jgi:hypothetical protein
MFNLCLSQAIVQPKHRENLQDYLLGSLVRPVTRTFNCTLLDPLLDPMLDNV